jgi:predicted alpha/beta-fold hydrolase
VGDAAIPPFRPAPWLPGPHAQTLFWPLARARGWARFDRERLETPDGDDLWLDHLDSKGSPTAPRLLLLHGLEGSSFSSWVLGMLALAAARGWRATALNFRSCAREPRRRGRSIENRRPRLYHSGETSDLDFVARTLVARDGGRPLLVAGVSLGGNVLLKWLGEGPGPSRGLVAAAAAVSVPFDLAAGARHLETAAGRLYVSHFLSTLLPKARSLARRFPEAAARLDLERLARARTFFDFDDAGTAPLHGFEGAEDYWARSSSLPLLGRIAVPVLAVSALDDPFLPPEALLRARAAASPAVTFAVSARGGHAGFVSGRWPTSPRAWAEEGAVRWLSGHLPGG